MSEDIEYAGAATADDGEANVKSPKATPGPVAPVTFASRLAATKGVPKEASLPTKGCNEGREVGEEGEMVFLGSTLLLLLPARLAAARCNKYSCSPAVGVGCNRVAVVGWLAGS